MGRRYLALSKPGIIGGNALTAIGGYCLGLEGPFAPLTFAAMLAGLSLVIASGCAANNCIDKSADALMRRTLGRPLPRGLITVAQARLFAIATGLLGTLILAFGTTPLSTALALSGWLIYVLPYSLLKYHTPRATPIGSLAGALPPIVGYCASGHPLDLGALLLFATVALWQMPHFYAISLARSNDYAAARIPVHPLVHGAPATCRQMRLYTWAFALAAPLLPLAGYGGPTTLTLSTALGIGWVALSCRKPTETWPRAMFLYSLAAITLLSALWTLKF